MQVETERWRITPLAKHMAQAVPLQSPNADNRRYYLPDEVFEAEEAAVATVGVSGRMPRLGPRPAGLRRAAEGRRLHRPCAVRPRRRQRV